MSLYAESSAVLAWLLDEDAAQTVLDLLAAEQAIIASDLTLVECDRALHRAVAPEEFTEAVEPPTLEPTSQQCLRTGLCCA